MPQTASLQPLFVRSEPPQRSHLQRTITPVSPVEPSNKSTDVSPSRSRWSGASRRAVFGGHGCGPQLGRGPRGPAAGQRVPGHRLPGGGVRGDQRVEAWAMGMCLSRPRKHLPSSLEPHHIYFWHDIPLSMDGCQVQSCFSGYMILPLIVLHMHTKHFVCSPNLSSSILCCPKSWSSATQGSTTQPRG